MGLVFSLWQEIETGKAAWLEEISLRHGVPASEHLSSVNSLRIHAEGPAADAAMVDCIEVLSAVDLVPRNIRAGPRSGAIACVATAFDLLTGLSAR